MKEILSHFNQISYTCRVGEWSIVLPYLHMVVKTSVTFKVLFIRFDLEIAFSGALMSSNYEIDMHSCFIQAVIWFNDVDYLPSMWYISPEGQIWSIQQMSYSIHFALRVYAYRSSFHLSIHDVCSTFGSILTAYDLSVTTVYMCVIHVNQATYKRPLRKWHTYQHVVKT
jgi:hypothetical protein